jgi:PAS domain S-box-containing protein
MNAQPGEAPHLGPNDGMAWPLLDTLWSSPMAMALVDRQLRVVTANAAFGQVMERSPGELPGERIESALGGAAPGPVRDLQRVLETGETPTGIPAEISGGAAPRHLVLSYLPVRTGAGEVHAVVLLARDITARQATEEAVRASQAEAERAVQALIRLQTVSGDLGTAVTPAEVARVVMEEGVGLLDATAGSISRSIGVDELEVLGAFGYPVQLPVRWRRYDAELGAPLSEAFRTGRPVFLSSPEAYARRYRHLASAARAFPRGASVALPLAVESRITGVLGIDFAEPVEFDAADRSVMLALAHQSAQALDRARLYEEEAALRTRAEHSAALLDTIFSSVPIGLAFVDWELRFVHVNAAWLRICGNEQGTCVGKTAAEVFEARGDATRVRRLRLVLERGEPVTEIESASGVDPEIGIARTWLESWYPVVAGGQTIGIGLVAREITEEKRAEAFRRNILGIVGHDLRNPLSAISGFARLLESRGGLDPHQLRMVSRIHASVARIDRIVRDLLDLTRTQAGGAIPARPQAARVDEIAVAVADEASGAFPGRDISVHGRGDPVVEWDPDRISQALSNLVVNALKYGDPSRPVNIEWQGYDDIVVRVHNWGPPIPPEVRGHLFEPFRQGREPGARLGGLGLGLYIAREVARAHGGTIDVVSSAEEGTAFTLRLPRQAVPAF